jgi:hypothetical protein
MISWSVLAHLQRELQVHPLKVGEPCDDQVIALAIANAIGNPEPSKKRKLLGVCREQTGGSPPGEMKGCSTLERTRSSRQSAYQMVLISLHK